MIRAEIDPEDGQVKLLHSTDVRIGLWLPTAGDGSYAELVEYVCGVLEDNVIHDDARNPTGSFDKLARGMVYSILHRLGIEWTWDTPQ